MAVLGVSSACAPGGGIERLADDAKEQMARRYLERLAAGEVDSLLSEIDPSLRSEATRSQLEKMRDVLPRTPPSVVNLVGYHLDSSDRGRMYNLTYQFGYGDKWILANAAWLERPSAPPLIEGLSASPLREPLQETNALSFRRAGPRHYLFALAGVLIPLFCLATLIASFRTRIERRKWLWRVFICLGFFSLSLNWTTGAISFAPFTMAVFGATAMAASIYSPWTISIALPIGAILFWFKRAQLRHPTGPGDGERPMEN